MTFTKTTPTVPGAYWWRRDSESRMKISQIVLNDIGILEARGEWGVVSAALRGGEWCGPLVPVEEVQLAYEEGWDNLPGNGGKSYADSRARRVVEGEEP